MLGIFRELIIVCFFIYFISHSALRCSPFVLFCFSCHNLKYFAEDWLSWSAANEEAVHTWQSDKVGSIGFSYIATIDNACHFCSFFAHVFPNPISDHFTRLLSLVSTCYCACVHGPERLVNNYALRPILNVCFEQWVQLLAYNQLRMFCLTLLLGFTNTVDNVKITVFSILAFLCDNLLVFGKISSPFMVADQHVINLVIFNCVRWDLARKCPLRLWANILGSN